eukprot:scaffold3014_cov19-Tisochrysis_lutea.AAC.2
MTTTPAAARIKRCVGWWTERRTLAPARLAAESASTNSRAETASRPESGSSAIMTLAEAASASVAAMRTMSSTPTETRRRSPPDRPRMCSPPIPACALWPMASASSALRAIAARARRPRCGSLSRACSIRCSSTVEFGGSTSACET